MRSIHSISRNNNNNDIIRVFPQDSSGFVMQSPPRNVCNGHTVNTQNEQKLYKCDGNGYMKMTPGRVLCGGYRVRKQLGFGTFSRVFECERTEWVNGSYPNQQIVRKYAVKVIRNIHKYRVTAKTEVQILRMIRDHDPDDISCCIHFLDHNQHRSHPIIIFPLMSQSIYRFMKTQKQRPFRYNDVIDILQQICRGVAFMHSLNVIIADLKPDNIVFVDHEESGDVDADSTRFATRKSTKIKIIDFGSAVIKRPGKRYNHTIRTRQYRAPEVVLKLGWDFSADIWSIGCILVELVFGGIVFGTHCSIDHLNQMKKCIGCPSVSMLDRIDDQTRIQYFDDGGNLKMDEATLSLFQCGELKTYFKEYRQRVCGDHLDDPRGYLLFDLCSKMMCWDPRRRITANQALQHPVFKLREN